jgi:PAS domain S-box-containing protein
MNDASAAPSLEVATPLDRTLVKAFLENVPDIVYFKDRQCRFIAVSRSKADRHGMKPEDIRGKTDADFFSAQHAKWARIDEQNIMATGEPVIGRLERTQWIDGREGWSEITKLPLRDVNGEIIGTIGLSKDITEAQKMALALEKAHRDLVEASRRAGMAEVATGVLHNVGNVLTSLNVSSNMIASSLRQSRAGSLAKVSDLLQAHAADLADFVDRDPKGRLIPEFIESLANHWVEDHERLLQEIQSLQKNVNHIKEIVSMQQAYATKVGIVETLDPVSLVEDALRMNAVALVRHEVEVVREFRPTPEISAEKAKVLQILVNLIRNAENATDEDTKDKKIIVRVEPSPNEGFIRFTVADNGVGISGENLPHVFDHGFTPRKEGHSFGLRSAAVTAREMNGSIVALSDGPGCGATFIVELPITPATLPSTDLTGP